MQGKVLLQDKQIEARYDLRQIIWPVTLSTSLEGTY
jgi:hypothetical protein